MMTLSPQDTKEGHWKKIPIHRRLVPILREVSKVVCLETDRVFVLSDEKGTRPLGLETFKNVWPRACEFLGLKEPWPHFHDLRHTWKTNARRSGMDAEIRERILGHWSKTATVTERYGIISNDELIAAIDQMTFNHGKTEILAPIRPGRKRADKKRTNQVTQKKGHA